MIFEPEKHSQLPGDINRYFLDLEELIFSDNRIEIIPNAVAFLNKLRVLKGANNRFLNTTPNLGLLERLEELDLTWNQLTNLQSIEWHKLYYLKSILLANSLPEGSENNFKNFNPGDHLWGITGIGALEQLDLRHWPFENNHLKNIKNLTKLKSLKLASQRLTVDENFATMILTFKDTEGFFLQLDQKIESKIIAKSDLGNQTEKVFLKIKSIKEREDVLPTKAFPVAIFWDENKATLCSKQDLKTGIWGVEIDPSKFVINTNSFTAGFTEIKLNFFENLSCDSMPTNQLSAYPISAYLFLKD